MTSSLIYTGFMEIFGLALVFFVPLFLILASRLIDNLKLWENKEYRFERILSHIYWDMNYSSRSFYSTIVKFVLFGVILTFTTSFTFSFVAIILVYAIWVIELFNYLNKYFYYRSFDIKSSVRNLSIIGLYSALLISLFFIIATSFTIFPRVENSIVNLSEYLNSTERVLAYPDALLLLVILSVIGLTLDLITPFITTLLVFTTSPLGRLRKLWTILKIKGQLRLLTGIKIVGITGSFGKSTLINYLDKLISDEETVFIKKDYSSIAALSSEISNKINHSTRYIFFEFEGYRPGEIRQITRILKPDVIALMDIGFNHMNNFESHEEFLNSYTEIENPDSLIVTNSQNDYNKDVISKIDGQIKDIDLGKGDQFEALGIQIKSKNKIDQKYKRYAFEIFAAINLLNEKLLAKISKTSVEIQQIEEIPSDNGCTIIIDSNENSDLNGLLELVSTKPSPDNIGLRILITDGFNELGKLKQKVLNNSVIKLSKEVDSIITTDYQLHLVAQRNNIPSNYFTGVNKLLVFVRSVINHDTVIYIEGALKQPMVRSLRKQD